MWMMLNKKIPTGPTFWILFMPFYFIRRINIEAFVFSFSVEL